MPTLREEIGKQNAFELLEQEAYLNILRTASQLAADFARLFRTVDLSNATYNVLRILRGSGARGRRCAEISEMIVTPTPDLTRLLDRLEKQGMIERERGAEDRRVVTARITPKGLDVLARLDQPVLDLHRAQLGHLSASDLEQLNRLLERARERTAQPTAATA